MNLSTPAGLKERERNVRKSARSSDRRDAMITAIAELDEALEGLQAIARLPPPENLGVMDLGEHNEVITRIVRATRAFKQAREANGG